MEFDCNNVDENEKYAFLLGSAIKNEDSDQFFSIYDSIIPKDLPDSQITQIKARVQEILDLPEEEFNDLVSKARHFSLASAGSSRMSCRETPDHTLSNNKHQTFYDESEDEGLGSATHSQARGTKSETSSLYSTTKCSTWSSESDTLKCDELNLCNSSRASNSINSLSDQDGSDCEGKSYSGSEYYPAKIRYPPQVKIRSGLGINLDYDEAYDARSEHSSHGDVNSPRSDISEGVEMVNMGPGSRPFVVDVEDDLACSRRGTSMDQDDFNTSEESDGEDEQRRNYYNQGYRPLLRESSKPLSTSKYGSTSYYSNRASSSLHYPEVDHPIVFSSLKDGTSKYSRHSTYDSTGSSSGLTAGTKDVQFEKNSYKKDRPPFGSKEQFNRVANSIDALITPVPDDEVRNMPEARRLEMLTPEESKKKKKKKKKDDVGTDQNGNPLVSPQDLKSGYRQMRESPSNSEGTAGNYQNITNYGAVQYSPYTTNEQSAFHKGNDTATRLQERRKGKRNKNKEEPQKSQDVKDYVGDKLPIEDLVSFIDGSLKKSKKQTPSSADDIPSKTQKQNKKSKDKKQKSPSPSIEEVEAQGDISAQPAILDQQGGSNNMGNLSGKTEVNTPNENVEIENDYAKKDKIANKSLLKDDTKVTVSDTILANHHMHMPQASSKTVYCKESVKDKEVPKTNNKRVAAASETLIGEFKPKKGGDKSVKVSKSEKVEMSKVAITKAENPLTIDTSVAANSMSVKQKNSKNKKSKPTSPSAKFENDVQVSEVLNEPSLLSQILDGEFIFTDLYVPEVPKEDEFQVVGKKKKKPVKEVVQPYQQNNYVNNGNKYVKRYEDKARSNSYVNNKFHPPITNNCSLQTENNVRVRDLSPSAFPALVSGKGRQAFNDGRRNSTGDVQIPSDLISQDDCDRESVKSLPATKPSNTTETVTSPRINMSYAKMAAGVTNVVLQTSSIGAGNVSSDPKITVWKGNARERRHSIGSSPEGVGIVAVHTPSSPTAVPIKAGSEENLKDVPDTSVVNATINVNNVSLDSLNNQNDSCRKGESDGSVQIGTDSVKAEERGNSVKEAAVSASLTVGVQSQPLASSRNNPVDKHNSIAATDNSDQLINCKLSNSKVVESECKINSISQPMNKQSAHRIESAKSKVNGTNNRKHKSVIFYDKRLEDTTSSLDISFGFEVNTVVDTEDSNETPRESTPSLVNHSDSTGITFNNSDLPANQLVQAVSCANITFNSNSTLDQPSIVNVIETPSSDSNSDNSSSLGSKGKELDADINEQINKVSSKLVHLNGVVSPAQGQTNNKLVKHVLEDGPPVNNETVSQPALPVRTVPKTDSPGLIGPVIERIYYGESVATLKKEVVGPSSTNGPTSYCGYIQILVNLEAKSNFNLAEAATFLNREWERTLKVQEKDPDNVKVFHEKM